MPLGRLTTDWKEMTSKSDINDKLVLNMPAMRYHIKSFGKVYEAKSKTLDGDFLVSTDRDMGTAIPPEVKYKLFKNGLQEAVGFVTEDAVSRTLKLYDALGDQLVHNASPQQVQFNGVQYEKVGSQGANLLYAHLDRTALGALRAGSRLSDADFNIYEGSMRKGLIPSGSTGSDGIKFESQGSLWVVKITIAMAQANRMDNTLSPAANEVRDPGAKRIYLDFNMLVNRH